MNKRKMLEVLAIYFMEKGSFLTAREYKAEGDGPYKLPAIRRAFTSYALLPKLMRRNHPEVYQIIMEGKAAEVAEAANDEEPAEDTAKQADAEDTEADEE